MARSARLALEIDGRGAKKGASEADRELAKLKQSARGTKDELERLSRTAKTTGDGLERSSRGARNLGSSLAGLKAGAAAAAIAIGLVAAAGTRFADASSKMMSQLRLATRDFGSFSQAQADVRRVASGARAELTSTATLYAAMARNARGLGASQAEVARATDTVTKAFKVSGASQSEQANATRQLGQALASGVLRGDEFNSVMENAPRLAKLLGDSLGVPTGRLREMAEAGELTSDKLFRAMTDRRFTEALDAEFRAIPATFDDAMTAVKNIATEVFGGFDRGGQFSQALYNFGKDGSADLKTIADAAETVGREVRAAFDGLGNVFEPMLDGARAAFSAMGIEADELAAAIKTALNPLGAGLGLIESQNRALKDNPGLYSAAPLGLGSGLSAANAGLDRYYEGRDKSVQRAQWESWYKDFTSGKSVNGLTFGDKSSTPSRATASNDNPAKKKARGSSYADGPSLAEVSRVLLKEFGGTITSTTGGKHVRGSDHYAGRAVDFVPAGGVGSVSKDQIEQLLASKGYGVRTNERGVKQLFGPGDKGHADHFHIAFDKARLSAEQMREASGKAALEMERLAEYGRSADREIQSLSDQLNDTPQAIVASRNALADIDGIVAELTKRKPPNWQEMVKSADSLRTAAKELANGPFNDMVKSMEEQAGIEELIIAGRETEAEVMRRTLQLEREQGALSDQQVAKVREGVVAERERAKAIAKQNELRQRDLELVERTQDNVRQTAYELLKGGGAGAIGNFFKRQFDLVVQNLADEITDGLFGDLFDNAKDKAMGLDKVKEANIAHVGVVNTTTTAIEGLGTAATKAADRMAGVDGNPATVDANGDIIVTAIRDSNKSSAQLFRNALKGLGKSVFGEELFSKLSKSFRIAVEGAAIGQASSGLLKSTGLKQSKVGSSIGGAIGYVVGGPVGALIGGAIGGTIGGLFKKTPKGEATISNDNVGYSGSGKLKSGLTALGTSVQDTIASIADQLGGNVGDYSVSVRQKGKKYYVNGQKFKEESEAARAAILAAIQDGAVAGIREGAQRLLQAGSDIDRQLSKAVRFNNVFRDLKARTDPVGAGIDDLNTEFESLKKVFTEASASAAEWADLEKLYQLKRTEIIEQGNNAALQSMRDYLNDLKGGSASPFSPQTRYDTTRAELDRLDALRAGGSKVEFDTYRTAADAFIAAARDYKGSTTDFFTSDFARVTSTVEQLIGSETARANTVLASVDFSGVTSAITDGNTVTAALLQQINAQLAGMNIGGNAGFTATNDNYQDVAAYIAAATARYYQNY